MFGIQDSMIRAYMVWIAIIVYYVQLSEARHNLERRAGGGRLVHCINYLDSLGISSVRVVCTDYRQTEFQCDRSRCNSGLGPNSDPVKNPFSKMVFRNCKPPDYTGPGKTVSNIVSMQVDDGRIAIQAGDINNPTLDYYDCTMAENPLRPFCQGCTLLR
ncbi:uncharacterized protein PGTG_11738 [Puccinia graminis f. sp. tritici CRL 75-36-700-3]|uniref:Uncharacterized protein n=1 Tax=Puccinia graminis f. sp. tritici (strain CRL 75-36-700-3 / race SCCL) TaxID=418459 RepID=E3KNV7_PUCGT|nr:uncharacterized protein PGTG_11738 [Puccinia graminis f. sp. tritici CRL 75-36-700-3]EFP85982.1 hypothetical protein PGTG_11738 [Puccinia graminis f. sp. tritici CRL 75-36-700-3]